MISSFRTGDFQNTGQALSAHRYIHTVRYEDFMNAVSEKTYFDANHRIISLSQEKLDAILETWESPVD